MLHQFLALLLCSTRHDDVNNIVYHGYGVPQKIFKKCASNYTFNSIHIIQWRAHERQGARRKLNFSLYVWYILFIEIQDWNRCAWRRPSLHLMLVPRATDMWTPHIVRCGFTPRVCRPSPILGS